MIEEVPYTPCPLLKLDCRLRLSRRKFAPIFLPQKCLCPPRRQRYFYGNADRAYNNTTLCFAKSCAKGCPFETPCHGMASTYLSQRKRRTISFTPIVLLLSHSVFQPPNPNVPRYFFIGCQLKGVSYFYNGFTWTRLSLDVARLCISA